MLHRRNHFHLLPAERGDHLIIDRAIRVEAAQSIEIKGEVFGLVDVGNLIFQGELFKFLFEHLCLDISLLAMVGIARIQRNGKII